MFKKILAVVLTASMIFAGSSAVFAEETPSGGNNQVVENNQGENNQGGNNQGENNQGGNNQEENNQGGNNQGENNQGGNNQGENNQGGNNQGGNNQGGNNQGGNNQEEPTVTAVAFTSRPDEVSEGQTFSVTLTVIPYGVDKEITWNSSNDKVIKINTADEKPKEYGKATASLTAVSRGTATLTATIDGKTASLTFVEPTIKSLEFYDASIPEHFVVGGSYDLSVYADRGTVLSSKVSFGSNDISWKISDEKVAKITDWRDDINSAGFGHVTVKVLKEGTTKLTAKSGSKTKELTIKAEKDKIASITVKAPKKVVYDVDQDLDFEDGVITLNHLNGTTEEVSMTDKTAMKDFEITGYDKKKVGKQTVTVSYTNAEKEKLTATFEVEVKGKVPKSIAVTTGPDKKEYNVNEAFDPKGMKLTVTYEDTTKEEIDVTSDMVYGYEPTRVGEQVLTVKYQDLVTTFSVTVKEAEKPWTFIDVTVDPDNWIYQAAKYVYDRDIMTGMDKEGKYFNPAGILSRGQFATIIYRVAGKPETTYAPVFPDVSYSDWFAAPAVWANKNGIITGYASGLFGPGDNITREQMALIMYRYAQKCGYDTGNKSSLSGFVDAYRVSSWAEEAMQWAVGNKIITGTTSTTLDPQGEASRAQAATIIMRFMELYDLA